MIFGLHCFQEVGILSFKRFLFQRFFFLLWDHDNGQSEPQQINLDYAHSLVQNLSYNPLSQNNLTVGTLVAYLSVPSSLLWPT